MYYKLPVKERIELMKSYRKANPDMSYQDMVNDYNTSYEKFGDGGKKDNSNNLIATPTYYGGKEQNMSQYPMTTAQKLIHKSKAASEADRQYNFGKALTNMISFVPGPIGYGANMASGAIDIGEGNDISGTMQFIPNRASKTVSGFNNLMTSKDLYDYGTTPEKTYSSYLPYYTDEYKRELFKPQSLTKQKYGGIQQFDNGGKKEREPIYVTNKNDPRLRAYNDSLNLHKAGVEKINFGKRFPQASNETLNKIEDIINEKYPITPSKSSFGSNIIESTSWEIMGTGPAKRGVPQYTKPVQPYIYKKPKEQPIVNNTVQDSVKYLPLIKTIPTLTDSVRQPEIIQPKIIQSGLKQPEQKSTYQKVSFRYDPVSKLQVPVLLTDPKMKVEQGTRIYNKYIPTVTGALPSDFKPEFNKAEVYEKTDPYWRSKFINPNSVIKK